MNFLSNCILIAGFLFFEALMAQSPYFVPANGNIPISATSINSMDVETTDVDNDGDLDIVIAGEYRRNLLFFNDGTGVFSEDPSRLFPEKNVVDGFPGEDSEDIAFADFDLDNDPDVIFVSEDTQFHELLVNDGNGSFTFIAYEFPASAGNAVAIMDLNNDNYPDIVIGNTGQNDVYINNQDLTFTKENNRWPVNTEGTQDLKLIDIDNDGDMDFVEGIDSGSNNVLINTNGFFTEANDRLPTTGLTLETRKITLGDVNGDTHPDIFVSTVNFTGTANLQNRLYINDGTGFFTDVTQTHLPVYVENTLDAVFLDYDMDNDLDLITTDFQNPVSGYHSFENDGTGVFVESTNAVFETFSLNNGIALHAADYNNDSYTDLYFGNFQETDDILFFSEDALGMITFEIRKDSVAIPNPADTQFKIYCPMVAEHGRTYILSVFDSKGHLVKKTSLSFTGTDSSIPVYTKNWPDGIYFYSLSSKESDPLCSGKLVVKH
ncbi:MAG: FG-GAP-like repeat-containing protein [Bacteroidota bacterium]